MINPYTFVKKLSDKLSNDHIIIPASSGSASEIMQQAFEVKIGQRVICSPGLGSMGFGLPHAIGVSHATDRPIVAVIGDGCLQHNIQELGSIWGRKIKLFIWNNRGYNSIKKMQDRIFKGNYVGCGVDDYPCLESLTDAYDLEYDCLMRHEDLDQGLDHMFYDDKSLLVEVIIDPDINTAPRIQSKLVDGKMVSGRLEDVK